MIYFDNAATTCVFPEVVEAMQDAMQVTYGNPSAKHMKGIEAENKVKAAQELIAKTLRAKPKEILFTSGGTESNNTAIIGNKIKEYSLSCSTIVPEAEVPKFEVENYFEKYYQRFTTLQEYANSSNIYDRYLLYLIEKGYQKKEIHAKVRRNDFTEEQKVERIAIELQEMALVTEKIKSSISSYYISTLELINIMWEEGDSLVGVARGSVTGMYTMYLIDLIQMNPLDWGLPHWRHISHEKAELSDLKKSAYIVIYMTKCGELTNVRCAKVLTVSVK